MTNELLALLLQTGEAAVFILALLVCTLVIRAQNRRLTLPSQSDRQEYTGHERRKP